MAIMNEKLSTRGRSYLRTVRALALISQYHAHRQRKNGEFHVDHLTRVAILLHQCGVRDDVTLACALLQDIHAKTNAPQENVERVGKDVAALVDAMTRKEGESVRERYARIEKDIRTVLVQAADRVLNTSDMLAVYPAGILERYCRDTKEHLLPMIDRVIRQHPKNRHRAVLRKLRMRIEQNVLNAEFHPRASLQRALFNLSRRMGRER